jgi:hypothetical protein
MGHWMNERFFKEYKQPKLFRFLGNNQNYPNNKIKYNNRVIVISVFRITGALC